MPQYNIKQKGAGFARSASGCVAARCAARASGEHYNIYLHCRLSNAVITIKTR